MKTKDIEYVAFEKGCIDFNREIHCPHCYRPMIPVCICLGMLKNKKFYCDHNFPKNCQRYGLPRYINVTWQELINYKQTGRL